MIVVMHRLLRYASRNVPFLPEVLMFEELDLKVATVVKTAKPAIGTSVVDGCKTEWFCIPQTYVR